MNIYSVVVEEDGMIDLYSYTTHEAAVEKAAEIAMEFLGKGFELPDFIGSPDDIVQYYNESGEAATIHVVPHSVAA